MRVIVPILAVISLLTAGLDCARGATVYVDQTATGADTGVSWTDA